jgi:hypothetical protein
MEPHILFGAERMQQSGRADCEAAEEFEETHGGRILQEFGAERLDLRQMTIAFMDNTPCSKFEGRRGEKPAFSPRFSQF